MKNRALLMTSPANFDSANSTVNASDAGTILVVEDEIPVRDFVAQVLRGSGYAVLTAASGSEALAVWGEEGGRIDLLLTDIVLPDGFSGADLARRLRREDAALKIIYASGYSMDFIGRKVVLMPGLNFLQKPYTPEELLRTVRENLHRESAVSLQPFAANPCASMNSSVSAV